MIGPVFDYLSRQDSATRGFIARVLVVTISIAMLGALAATIYLSATGRNIPPQLGYLLAFLTGSGVFGIGSHSTAGQSTVTQGKTP